MMPMNPMGPPTETAAPVASDALKKAARCARVDVQAVRPGAVGAEAQQVQRPRQPGEHARTTTSTQRQRRDERLVAADVEVAHQPAQRAVGLGEVGEVLHEQDQRREERVHRHAGEQQHVGRHPAVPRAGERVDDGDGARASRRSWRPGHAGMPAQPNDQPKVIASIAPSAAPAETPSVNGVASGLRSSPWNTTPAEASVDADQRAGQRARQARDEEDLRVHVVGEGNRRSNARRRLIGVDPMSGAITIAATASVAEAASVSRRRRPTRGGHARGPAGHAPDRHDDQTAGRRVPRRPPPRRRARGSRRA